MAATKKPVTPAAEKPAAAVSAQPKTEVKKAETPATPVKTESEKETAKETVKKVAVKEAAAKKEPVKKASAKKETAKKEPAKKTAAKKAELKSEVCVQFDGKSYTEEELVKIAKDVWKYDLKQKAGDLTKVELYVKPEESMVYYVMNNDFAGSFSI